MGIPFITLFVYGLGIRIANVDDPWFVAPRFIVAISRGRQSAQRDDIHTVPQSHRSPPTSGWPDLVLRTHILQTVHTVTHPVSYLYGLPRICTCKVTPWSLNTSLSLTDSNPMDNHIHPDPRGSLIRKKTHRVLSRRAPPGSERPTCRRTLHTWTPPPCL